MLSLSTRESYNLYLLAYQIDTKLITRALPETLPRPLKLANDAAIKRSRENLLLPVAHDLHIGSSAQSAVGKIANGF